MKCILMLTMICICSCMAPSAIAKDLPCTIPLACDGPAQPLCDWQECGCPMWPWLVPVVDEDGDIWAPTWGPICPVFPGAPEPEGPRQQ